MLDLGCGVSKHSGCLGVDMRKLGGVDIVADASKLPFKDDCFDKVFLRHIVEHVLDITSFMKEIWRVTKNGATVRIWTPHFTAYHSYRDPTHLHHLTIESFDYFDSTTALGKEFRFSSEFDFRIEGKRIVFTKRIFWNYLIKRTENHETYVVSKTRLRLTYCPEVALPQISNDS